jgi:type VI secretion system Hcp family effector
MPEIAAGTSMYLHIEGTNGGMVKGESRDAVHVNEIQLQSFDVHVSADKTGGEGAWRSQPSPVNITVVTGRSSPTLFLAACAGTVYKRFTISCHKIGAGKDNGDYLQWRFSDVQVVDYSLKMEEDKPTETIQISYHIVEMYYARQDHDGVLKDPVNRAWDMSNFEAAKIAAPLPFKPKPGVPD